MSDRALIPGNLSRRCFVVFSLGAFSALAADGPPIEKWNGHSGISDPAHRSCFALLKTVAARRKLEFAARMDETIGSS